MRSQKLAGHIFHEHLHKNEKFQLTVFSYSYGVQVEFFDKNKYRKAHDTGPLT